MTKNEKFHHVTYWKTFHFSARLTLQNVVKKLQVNIVKNKKNSSICTKALSLHRFLSTNKSTLLLCRQKKYLYVRLILIY